MWTRGVRDVLRNVSQRLMAAELPAFVVATLFRAHLAERGLLPHRRMSASRGATWDRGRLCL